MLGACKPALRGHEICKCFSRKIYKTVLYEMLTFGASFNSGKRFNIEIFGKRCRSLEIVKMTTISRKRTHVIRKDNKAA